MTLSPDEIRDLRTSIVQLCEGRLADREGAELKSRLTDSEEARRIFVGYEAINALLELEVPTLEWDDDDVSPPPAPVAPLSAFGSTWHGANSYMMSHELFTGYIVATVFFAIAAIVASQVYMTQYQVAGNSEYATPDSSRPTSLPLEHNPEPEIVSVGRITGTVDCVWVNTNDAPFHNRVVQGDKFMLKSGLMEITYHTGAKVILQGPCTYEVESTAGGYLSLGKLTARVEKKSGRVGEGETRRLANSTSPVNPASSSSPPLPLSHSPTLFSVRTPTAVVTDLGTEFGVEVDNGGTTHSHVYRGKVELRVIGGSEKSNQVVTLEANESARIGSGETRVITVNRGKTAESNTFVREIPTWAPIKLFNTGEGLMLGEADPHWQVIAVPNDSNFKPQAAITMTVDDPCYHKYESTRSQWISVPQNASKPDGLYTYRTQFDLAGLDPKTAILNGGFTVDNHVMAIRLNGHDTPVPSHNDDGQWDGLCRFTIRGQQFVEGINTLEIVVRNNYVPPGNNPMALRVELQGLAVKMNNQEGR